LERVLKDQPDRRLVVQTENCCHRMVWDDYSRSRGRGTILGKDAWVRRGATLAGSESMRGMASTSHFRFLNANHQQYYREYPMEWAVRRDGGALESPGAGIQRQANAGTVG